MGLRYPALRPRRGHPYDALSRWYRLLADPTEGPLRRECLDRLALQSGETILEVGSGPGTDLTAMADGVGAAGSIWGLDLSWGMLRVSRQALRRHKGDLPIRLLQGDALVLPFRPEAFDAVVLSFTLESFGEAEMPQVLREAARVLRVGGRIGIVSLSSRHPGELVTRMYWWAHKAVPGIIDCRPIDPSERLKEAGFHIADEVERSMWGLRVAIVVAHR